MLQCLYYPSGGSCDLAHGTVAWAPRSSRHLTSGQSAAGEVALEESDLRISRQELSEGHVAQMWNSGGAYVTHSVRPELPVAVPSHRLIPAG